MGVLEYQLDGHVGLLTLNRPEARNSLNPELIVGLAETWERVKEDPVVRVVVLTGADGSTFCSGFDLGTTIPLITGSREPQNQFEEAIAADRRSCVGQLWLVTTLANRSLQPSTDTLSPEVWSYYLRATFEWSPKESN